jgi:uncharacterized membrane protein
MKAVIKFGIIGLIIGIIADILIVYLIPLIIGNLSNSRDILEMSCFSCIYTDYIKLFIFAFAGLIIGLIVGKIKGENKQYGKKR